MSVELATAYVSIVPSAKGIGSKLSSELGGPIEQEGSRSGNRFTRALGSVARRGAIVAGGVIAGGFAATLAKGFGRLRAIDDARFKLQGLGHDTKTVDTIMTNALNSVKGTAFGLDEAASVAAMAVAAGVKPGQELERTLSLTGDAATIAGVSMDEMGAIFGKVSASNRLYMREVNQLALRGIPIMQWLAEEYGVTADEARAMVTRGEVDFATFQTVIEKNIGGAALTAGESFTGMVRNVGAAMGRLGAILLGPVFEAAKGWGKTLIDSFDRLGEVAGRTLNDLGVGWRASAADASLSVSEHYSAATNVGIVLRKVFDGVSDFFTNRVVPAFRKLSDWWQTNGPQIIARVTELGGGIRDVLGGAFDFISGLWTGTLQPIFSRIIDAFTDQDSTIRGTLTKAWETVIDVMGRVGEALSTAGDWWRTNGPQIVDRAERIGEAVGTVLGGAFDLAAGIWTSLLEPALTKAKDLFTDNDGIIRNSLEPAFNLLVGTLETAGTILSNVGTWMDENRGATQALATTIGVLLIPKMVQMGVTALTSGAMVVKAWALKNVEIAKNYLLLVQHQAFAIRYYITLAVQAAKSAAIVVVSWVKMGVAATVNGAKMALAWTVGIIRQAAVSAATMAIAAAKVVAGWVMMGIKSLIAAGKMALAWVIAMGPVGWVIAIVIGLVALIIANWDRIVEWTRKAWDWVSEKVRSAWETVKRVVTDAVERVKTTVTGWVTTVRTKATELRDRVVTAIRTLRDRVVNAFTTLRTRAVAIILGLYLSARARFDEIKEKVTSAVQDARDRVVEAFQAMRDWVREKIDELITFVRGMPDRIKRAIPNPLTMLRQIGQDIIQGLINGIGALKDAAADKAREVASGISSAVTGFFRNRSPSKLMFKEGQNVTDGLGLGIANRADVAASMAGRAARSIVAATNRELAGIDVDTGLHDLERYANRMPDLAGLRADVQAAATVQAPAPPHTLVIVDQDGQLIGRMRVEADRQLAVQDHRLRLTSRGV